MVDVLVEGTEGLDEDIGFLLNEDMILLTFPFSALVPAALEARNKLLLGTESAAGTCAESRCLWRSGLGAPGPKSVKSHGQFPEWMLNLEL